MLDLIDKYRHTFLKDEISKDALADLLAYCDIGDYLLGEEHSLEMEVGRRNVGIYLLISLGILQRGNPKEFINALCSVPPPIRKVGEDE